jgi:hypothetical protein
MLTSRRALSGLCAGLLVSLIASANALASPVTVNLRVEGSTSTLYEGPITTEAETIETASSNGAHPCNYTENGSSEATEGDGGSPSGTPTTALHAAAIKSGLAFNAEWYGHLGGVPGDFFITQVGSDANESSAPFDAWGYAVNDTTAPVGGCQIALAPGNEVLWAYNYFNLPHLLSMTGPTVVEAGQPFTVRVLDGHSGEALSGAVIGEDVAGVTTALPGSPVTNQDGYATVTLARAGTFTLKATRSESVRSNGVTVCVHDGNDGTCGTSVPTPITPDVPRVIGVENGRVYSRRGAPRVLRGTVEVPDDGTLRDVRIRLERNDGGHCFNFNGGKAAFVRARKCRTALFFTVGQEQSFSYLLPSRLPAGRYVYEIEAVNTAGETTKTVGGVSDVVFRVK